MFYPLSVFFTFVLLVSTFNLAASARGDMPLPYDWVDYKPLVRSQLYSKMELRPLVPVIQFNWSNDKRLFCGQLYDGLRQNDVTTRVGESYIKRITPRGGNYQREGLKPIKTFCAYHIKPTFGYVVMWL